MVKLRLARGGRKKRPFYRIVAAHSEFKRDGRFLEKVGTYDPLASIENQVVLKDDRIMYWLQNGAQPTDTVRNIISAHGLMLKLELIKSGTDSAEIDGVVAKFREEKAASLAKKQANAAKVKEEKAKQAAIAAAAEVESEEALVEDEAVAEVADETSEETTEA